MDQPWGDEIPRQTRSGIGWPATPGGPVAAIMALSYQLDKSQFWDAEKLLTAGLAQLVPLIRHAQRTVPFYAERLQGIDAKQLTIEAWRRIPILARADIQNAGDALISTQIPADHGKPGDVVTSGSVGRPIKVKNTNVTRLFHAAFNLRYHQWHGRDFSARVCCIRNLGPAMAKAAKAGQGVGWVPAFRSGPMLFFDITRPITEQLDWLIEKDPDYLLTFPSNLAALLALARERGARPEKLRQAATMSEVLTPSLRPTCREVWDIPISDAYSTEEAGMVALQCPDHDHYHVQAENILLEVLDEEGMPCPPGEVGRIVLSDLHNFASPLIRYEIGDYAEVGEPCPCGRGLPVLARILGRARGMLSLPGGERFWPSFPESEMLQAAPVRQFQIIQRDLQNVEAKLVMENPPSDQEKKNLHKFLIGCLRHEFDLELSFVEEIPRSPSGKYEDFMNLTER